MADDSDKCNYEVGYGKPPKANQFQPGTSGNPKGRRKGSRNLKDFAREELDRKQRVTADGKMRSLSNREIIVLAQINKAPWCRKNHNGSIPGKKPGLSNTRIKTVMAACSTQAMRVMK